MEIVKLLKAIEKAHFGAADDRNTAKDEIYSQTVLYQKYQLGLKVKDQQQEVLYSMIQNVGRVYYSRRFQAQYIYLV
jgi:hypothetical protein